MALDVYLADSRMTKLSKALHDGNAPKAQESARDVIANDPAPWQRADLQASE